MELFYKKKLKRQEMQNKNNLFRLIWYCNKFEGGKVILIKKKLKLSTPVS